MLKTLVTAAFGAVLAIGIGTVTASADGYKGKAAAPVYEKPACAQFGGFYVGAHVGTAYHDWRWEERNLLTYTPATQSSDSGFIGGGQVGFNAQRGCTVFGIEADLSWADLETSVDRTLFGYYPTTTVRGGVDWFGTIRTRAGIVVDSLMLYVTGGLAYANFNRGWEFNDASYGYSTSFRNDDTRWGWVAGFGTEYAISDRISIKSEALYVRFEDERTTASVTGCGSSCGGGPSTYDLRVDHHDSLWIGRIGLNIKLGGHREQSYDALK